MTTADNNIKLIRLLADLLESDQISPEAKQLIQEELDKELEEINLKRLAKTAAVAGGIGLATLGAGKIAKDRAYKNIYPYGYSTTVTDKDGTTREIGPLERGWRAIVLNQQEIPRLNMELNPTGFEKEKLDLWGMYLGKDQVHNTIKNSKYKPSKGSGGGKYYSVPKLEDEIIGAEKNIKAKDFTDFTMKFLELADQGKFGSAMTGDEGKSKRVVSIQPLGNATISVGEDGKGYYISYYDRWDINPLLGGTRVSTLDNKTVDRIVKFFDLDKKEDLLGGDALEIYGRVYYDKETGNIIQ